MTMIINCITGIQSEGNIQTDGYLIGDGSQIQDLNIGNIDLANISGNLIPVTSNTYSLGNATNQFLDLWVSNSTVYLNNVPLTVNSSNILLVANKPVVISSNTLAPVTANIATTADVIAGNLVISASGSLTFPDGSTQTTAYDNDNVEAELPLYSGNLTSVDNITTTGDYISSIEDIVADSSLSTVGNVYGNNILSYLLTTGTLTTAAQPNITGLGTQSTLVVAGNTTANGLSMTSNVTVNHFSVTGNISYPGNVLIVYGNRARYYGDSFGFGAWYAGIQAGKPAFTQTTSQFGANYDDYAQINFQNVNTTGNATTDYIVAADNYSVGNQFYAALGISSSSYAGSNANPVGNIVQSNDGYVYVKGANAATQGGNLIIGTATTGAQVKFLSGAGDSGNVLMSIGNGNVTVNGTLSAQYFIGDGSNLAGLVNGNRIHFGNSEVVIANVGGGISLQNGSNAVGNIGLYSLALGNSAGRTNQGNLAVALGNSAGNLNQGAGAIAIGAAAGNANQNTYAVAIGQAAGAASQSANAVGIGALAGFTNQGTAAVAVGYNAGSIGNQGANAVAIGGLAGYVTQGANSVAIGQRAGYQNQPQNSTVINGTSAQVSGNAVGSTVMTPVYPSAGLQPSNSLYYAVGNSEVQYGPTNGFYSSFNYINSGVTLGTSQIGGVCQIATGTTVYLPGAASIPNGGRYKIIVAGTGNTVKVFCQGGEFIYCGNRSLSWIVMLPGEILEIASRGPGTTEWDVTGGTAVMKYLNTNNQNNFFGYTWKASIPPNSPPSTSCIHTIFNAGSNSTTDIQIQYRTDGYLYLATSTGTINYNASTVVYKSGSNPQLGGFTNNGSVGTGFSQLSFVTLSSSGDTATTWIQDLTNNINWRVWSVKRSTDNYASICIERQS